MLAVVVLVQAETLTGRAVEDLDSARDAVRDLLARGPGRVVLTLGARGVVFSEHNTITHISAQQVDTVDTTVSLLTPQ